jgi:hypothetical protein
MPSCKEVGQSSCRTMQHPRGTVHVFPTNEFSRQAKPCNREGCAGHHRPEIVMQATNIKHGKILIPKLVALFFCQYLLCVIFDSYLPVCVLETSPKFCTKPGHSSCGPAHSFTHSLTHSRASEQASTPVSKPVQARYGFYGNCIVPIIENPPASVS